MHPEVGAGGRGRLEGEKKKMFVATGKPRKEKKMKNTCISSLRVRVAGKDEVCVRFATPKKIKKIHTMTTSSMGKGGDGGGRATRSSLLTVVTPVSFNSEAA